MKKKQCTTLWEEIYQELVETGKSITDLNKIFADLVEENASSTVSGVNWGTRKLYVRQ